MILSSKYSGIKLNGKWFTLSELAEFDSQDTFENQIISFCLEFLNDSETIEVQTSGSTGAPKSINFSKSALEASAGATNNFFELTQNDTALLALPMDYVAAKLMVIRAMVGEYNLLTRTPSLNPLKHLKETVSFCPLTPSQVLNVFDESPDQFEKVKVVLIGGGDVSKDLVRYVANSASEFYVGFGMAETLTHFAVSRLKLNKEIIYHPLEGVQISTDNRGCLMVNREGITNGAIKTNDLVEIVEGGFKWLGRIDNLINSGGVKIIPEEVESLIRTHTDKNFFLAGVPDKLFGEKLVLFLEGQDIIDTETIAFKHPFHKPKQVINIKRFDYTKSGKIRRKETVNKWLESQSNVD